MNNSALDNTVKSYIMSKTAYLQTEFINDLWSGCTFMTNGEAAHTIDYPDILDDIVASIADNGMTNIEPDTEDFLVAAAQLGFVDIEPDLDSPTGYVVRKGVLPEAIFKTGIYTFVPDTLNINFKTFYSDEQ